MFKKVKKVTISSPQKNDLPKPQTRSHSRLDNHLAMSSNIKSLMCLAII